MLLPSLKKITFYLPVLLFCMLIGEATFGQRALIVELNNQIIETSPDSNKANIYKEMAVAYRKINIDSAIYFNKLAYSLAKKNNLEDLFNRTTINMGIYYSTKGVYEDAQIWLNQGIKMSKVRKDTLLTAIAESLMGSLYLEMEESEKALEYFQLTLEPLLANGETGRYLNILNNLGVVSFNLKKYDKALTYFEAYKIGSIDNQDTTDIALAYMNIGEVYLKQGKIDMALKEFNKAINLIEVEDYPLLISLGYFNLSAGYHEEEKYNKALKASKQGLTIYEKYQINGITKEVYEGLTRAFIGVKDYTAAVNTAQTGIELVRKLGVRGGAAQLYQLASEAYEKDNQLLSALLMARNYIQLNDSLSQLKIDKKVANLEFSYEIKQKETENALLKEEQKNQALTIQQRTNAMVVISLILLLLSVILFQVYKARNKSRNLNEELEEKIKLRTAKLELLNKKLLQSNKELERFNYIASHDLKEPVRIIGNFTGLIKMSIKTKEYDDLEKYLDFVEKSIARLNKLIETTLEYSSMEFEQRSKLRAINLENEVAQFKNAFQAQINQRGIQIISENLPTIKFHPFVIKLIFKNLIENAIKFNKSEPPIVRISCKKGLNDFTLFFEDNGIGIHPQHHKKVFEMFIRLNNREDFEGTGMGLAFCKKILENNGGHITVKSKENEGSTFIVALPTEVVQLQEQALALHSIR